MKVNEKMSCSFQNWYPQFKENSLKSIFLPLPNDVLEYLQNDIVTIPSEAVPKKVKCENVDDVTYSDWDSDGEDEDEIVSPSFPDFSAQLKRTIDSFGGSAFIKMNWSAPTDAAWVATNNCLKCCNLQDVYLLLKCSDKISRDLSYCGGSDQHFIVLKKWEDIHPGSEFRCFVSDGELLAITQRGKSEFHRHIMESKFNISKDIKEFFNYKLKDNFILSNFLFDVVWHTGSRVKLVDINILSEKDTETYLYTKDELRTLQFNEEISPELRFISEDIGIQPSHLSRHFGMPFDLVEMSGSTSRSLIEMLQTQIVIQAEEKK